MYVHQYTSQSLPDKADTTCELVLVFTGYDQARFANVADSLGGLFPNAIVVGCSTAGEILDTTVTDEECVITTISFEHTRVFSGAVDISSPVHSSEAGRSLAHKMLSYGKEPLKHLFVLSDGLKVNGSDLVESFVTALPSGITITGGLAGDGGAFQETYTLFRPADTQNQPKSGQIVAIGLYGSQLNVRHGCVGGWDPFGTERLITRSSNNVLYELDGKPALDLYKQYLGEHAEGLPATGLLFPLTIRSSDKESTLVRTILGVDEAEKSLTFAGNVPTGQYARFMKANFTRLVVGAEDAAAACVDKDTGSAELALLVSCVGRKMILKQRIEEEVEAVRDQLGPSTPITGFYSYGEISPLTPQASCELHNQTMTITTLWEQ